MNEETGKEILKVMMKQRKEEERIIEEQAQLYKKYMGDHDAHSKNMSFAEWKEKITLIRESLIEGYISMLSTDLNLYEIEEVIKELSERVKQIK